MLCVGVGVVLVERHLAFGLVLLLLHDDLLGFDDRLFGHLGGLHQHAHVVQVVLRLDLGVGLLVGKLRAALAQRVDVFVGGGRSQVRLLLQTVLLEVGGLVAVVLEFHFHALSVEELSVVVLSAVGRHVLGLGVLLLLISHIFNS